VSLRAKQAVGSSPPPGVKPLVRGLVGGRSPHEADHADDILQFNAQICQASVTELFCVFGSFAEVCHGIYLLPKSNNLEACSMLNSYFVRL